MYVAPYTRPVRTVQWEVLGRNPHIYPINGFLSGIVKPLFVMSIARSIIRFSSAN
jgi:hypothetical protein